MNKAKNIIAAIILILVLNSCEQVSGPISTTTTSIVINTTTTSSTTTTTIYIQPTTTTTTTTTIQANDVYKLYSYNGIFLGNVNNNQFDSNSLANSFGTYGNKFSSMSIWNQFGDYGSLFSSYSAYNNLASYPPVICENGIFYCYLTKNNLKTPKIDPNALAISIGRSDVVR